MLTSETPGALAAPPNGCLVTNESAANRTVECARPVNAGRNSRQAPVLDCTNQKRISMVDPTAEYESLNRAFAFFNGELFDDRLPSVLLTFRKRGHCLGYYRHQAFASRVNEGLAIDEIALCINTFRDREDKDVLSILVHEMVHLWQFCFGRKIPRRSYHNLEWTGQMLQVGLHPSDTGKPGGRTYGYSMMHYVIGGGAFDRAAGVLLGSGWQLHWEENRSRLSPSGSEAQASGEQTRKKFMCAACGMAAWAKYSASLVCGTCSIAMI